MHSIVHKTDNRENCFHIIASGGSFLSIARFYYFCVLENKHEEQLKKYDYCDLKTLPCYLPHYGDTNDLHGVGFLTTAAKNSIATNWEKCSYIVRKA